MKPIKTCLFALGAWGIVMSLSACEKTSKSSAATPAADTALTASAVQSSVVDVKQLGVFAGTFDASVDQIKLRKAYITHTESIEPPMHLEDLPEKFHAHVYQDPLYGDFNFAPPNRVTLIIDGLFGDKTVKGKSVAAGNLRAVTGQWEADGANYKLTLKEPGDNPNDGVFTVNLNPKTGLLAGFWKSVDGSISKSFTLKQTVVKSNPKSKGQRDFLATIYADVEESAMKDPSVDVLKSKDVENLYRPQIRMLRNLIFARHGVSFENKPVRYVFEAQDWYVPYTVDTQIKLTDIETQNLAVLKRYEAYAEDSYNSYGR